jgi:hypothetical protein
MKEEPDIASGRVDDLLAAISNPHPEHDLQGQTVRDFPLFEGDQLQGQQHIDPYQAQENFIRPDEAVRPQPLVEHGGSELPPQQPPGNPDELQPTITTIEGLGRKT